MRTALLLLGAGAVGAVGAREWTARAQPPTSPPPGDVGGMVGDGMDHAMDDHGGHGAPEEALHLRLTPSRPPTHADSLRAAALVDTVRRALARYADPASAEADGYRLFLPGVRQHVYHYTNYGNAIREAFRFDPAAPTSLLYRAGPDGRRVLVGAMYTAPAWWDADRLDARVPLSVARWHQHVHWCLPPRGAPGRWGEMQGGKPVFGPASPIATRAACEAVGGTFRERLFGWMVHVNAFATDPRQVWAH